MGDDPKLREKWLAERNSMIGASETPSILGRGFETAADVWARKIGAQVDNNESLRLFIGNALQPGILEIARHVMGLPIVDEEPFRIRRYEARPYIGASLDAYIDDNGVHAPLDAKNVDRMYSSEWEAEPPVGYQIQLQQQMLVTGASYGYLFALIGGNQPVFHRVERNDEFIAAMLKKLAAFWKLVQTRTPPPYEDAESQSRVIAALYPKDNGSTIALSDDAVRLLEQREFVNEQFELLKKSKEGHDNALKLLLGDNSYGVLPDGRWISWKTTTRKSYVVAETSYRTLRIHDKQPKGAPALPPPEAVPAITDQSE